MSTRGYLLFRTQWNGPYEAYYQHHDTYPTGLGISLVEVLKTTAHMEGKITPEKIVQELNSMGYNLQRAQRTLSKPEQAFQHQSHIEWIYAVTIDDTPESSSLQLAGRPVAANIPILQYAFAVQNRRNNYFSLSFTDIPR